MMIQKGVLSYRVCQHIGANEMAKEVNQLLAEGFILYGSPFSSDGSKFQAMVKLKTDEGNSYVYTE